MSPEIILALLVILIVGGFVFSQVLEFLNLRNQSKNLPDNLKEFYTEERYQLSLSYHKSHWKFGLLSGGFQLAITLTLLLTGFYGWLDEGLRKAVSNPAGLSLVFFIVISLFSSIIQLPFSWYENFRIEEAFGFNKMSSRTFFTDQLKGLMIGGVVGVPLLWIFLKLVEQIGPQFWVWFGLVATGFIIFMNLFYTSLLLPLFNKLSPLPDGELKTAILNFSKKVDFPVNNILVMDGSKRSSKANAFFSGLGRRKKVVLFDTLIEKHTIGELIAILAHEVGHYKKKHIVLGLFSSVIQIFFILWVLSLFIGKTELSFALGGNQNAVHLNLLAFGILFSPVSGIASMLSMVVSRAHEFQADAYAKAHSEAKELVSGLKKLSTNNLSNLTPHPIYVFFHYSHPPVLKRIEKLLS